MPEWVNFLWAALVVPLGYQWTEIQGLKKQVTEARDRANSADIKAGQAITEQRVRDIMKEEMEPIRNDLKQLSKDINQALREFDQKAHNLALDIARGRVPSGKY